MLLKYWMKDARDVSPTDSNTLRQLRGHFAEEPASGATVGQQLKRVNSLMQLDWMLGDPNRLQQDFREYVSLLSANQLDRMILFGGQNCVETTARWGQREGADRLLRLWLEPAISRNDVAAILDFADGSVRQGRLWTAAELLRRLPNDSRLSSGDRFVAQATRCLALARIYQTKERADATATDLATVQKRWAVARLGEQGLRTQAEESAKEAREAFGTLTKPTREQQALKRQLDTIVRTVLEDGSKKNASGKPEHVDAP